MLLPGWQHNYQGGATTSVLSGQSSQTVTMITGCNAFGKALPPHFQFMTHAETDEGKQIKVDAAVFCPGILGQWGGEEEVCAPVTFGVNKKGGMDEAEFSLYLQTAVMPLYPNAAPEMGKWVILKCDRGPGRLNT